MRRGRNPMQELLHEQMGIDTFTLDGDDAVPADSWMDRPARCKSPRRR